MDSPPHLSANIKSFLHQILHSQQIFHHNLSVLATKISYLTRRITPPSSTCIGTEALPAPVWFSLSSFNPQPPISNPTYLRHHGYHYQESISHIEFKSLNNHSPDPTLNNDFAIVFFPSIVQIDEEEVKPQTCIPKSNSSTIADEEGLSVTANFTTPQTNEISQELVAIKAKDQEETPHPNPPSIFLSNAPISTPLFFTPTEKGENEIAKSQDLIVDSPTVKISGLQLWFDFVFFARDLVHPTCFELGKYLSATSLSLAKTKGNTIFVFDPGGTFLDAYHPFVCHLRNRKFLKLLFTSSSFSLRAALSYAGSVMAATSPATTSFPAMEPSLGPASGWSWVPRSFGTQRNTRITIGFSQLRFFTLFPPFLGQPVFNHE